MTQLTALIDLYHATRGPYWFDSCRWNISDSRIDTWYGITVNVITNDITDILLTRCNLTGTIPTSIGLLTALEYFVLNQNHLTGTLPSQFGRLASLQCFSLANNYFHGTIPWTMGNMTTLKVIDLSVNRLSGTIPPSLGNLQSLIAVAVLSNSLTGELPVSLQNISSLENFYFNYNAFTGPVISYFEDMVSLSELLVNDNYFTGVLPRFNSTANVSLLFLDNNYFTGTLPVDLIELKELFQFSVTSNLLTGTISSALCDFPKIYYLRLAENMFDCFEACLQTLTGGYYDYFDSAELLICGNQTQVMCQLAESLQFMSALGKVTTIPTINQYFPDWQPPASRTDSFSYFEPNIVAFRLAFSSSIVGALDSSMVQYVRIDCRICNSTKCFDYGYDDRDVSLPAVLPGFKSSPPYVSSDPYLSISCKRSAQAALDTSFPVFRGFSIKVDRVLMRNGWQCDNRFVNPCSWHGVECALNTAVIGIDLSNLHLTGTIPSSLLLPSLVQKLDLSSNSFSGPLPVQGVSSALNLKILDVNHNRFSGTIPSLLATLSSLENVDLSFNAFTGEVPASLCRIENVSVIQNGFLNCYQNCGPLGQFSTRVKHDDVLGACKSSADVLGEADITGIAISCLVVVIICGYLLRCYRQYTYYLSLPLHGAVVSRKPLTPAMLKRYSSETKRIDRENCTVLDHVLARLNNYSVSEEVLYLLVMESMPCDTETGSVIDDPNQHHFGWAKLVERSEDIALTVVERILDVMEAHVEYLAFRALDMHGRRCVDIASPACREAILRATYLDRRFDMKAGAPEHKSATSVVIMAIDHASDGRRVALKFLKHRVHYETEVRRREEFHFDATFVVSMICHFDGDAEDEQAVAFRKSSIKRGFAAYPYCVVLEAAETNLQRVILQQNIAGNDWDIIRIFTKNLCACLAHIHNIGVVHGDIKPLNVVLLNNSLHLIDFDASVNCGNDVQQYVGRKYSSAYLPPEMFYRCSDGRVMVRSYKADGANGESVVSNNPEYELVKASPAHDMWSLGVLLYLLCSGTTLFQASVDDNLSPLDMGGVLDWDDDIKTEKLTVVEDLLARNLLSLLLERDPLRRLGPNQVINHPFVSGVHVERLQGEAAAWDVFLSYRVDSDSHHVEMIYDALTARGLKVWWDKKCLEPGLPWEEGFCNGLMNSACFVCLLSRKAINHPTKPWQDFKQLVATSRCDNVLLEWRLALELRERRMLEGVFPIFIGDLLTSNDELETDSNTMYSDYFSNGCHPAPLPSVRIDSLELKLREHLHHHGLGLPLISANTVVDIVGKVTAYQGGFIRGPRQSAIDSIAVAIQDMHNHSVDRSNHRRSGRSLKANVDSELAKLHETRS